MDWVCLFRGGGPTDAWLVRDWLLRNGLEVRVQGDLSGLHGQIPIGDAWPSVWVRRSDLPSATDALRQYDASPRLVHPVWRCACGEENEANFESCWSCQTDRPS
jgi:hypothetical protein